MSGIGSKIKDALTPGHHRHEGDAYTNEPGYAGNAPMTGNNPVGGEGPGMGGAGMGGAGTVERGTAYNTEGVGGAYSTGAGTNTGVTSGGDACQTRTFTEVEDRPVMKERVERIVEHRPVEKQFVVETRPVGEREVEQGRHYESAGVREYEVDRVEGTSCPTTTGAGAGTGTNTAL